MSRNFGGYKSGHGVSDAYFKKQPIWFFHDVEWKQKLSLFT